MILLFFALLQRPYKQPAERKTIGMKKMVFTKTALITGRDALDYLRNIEYKKAVIVTGGQSMVRTGVIDRVKAIMYREACEIVLFSGISKNPTTGQVEEGVAFFHKEKPDVVLALGGGSAIDAAKVMLLFYEHPEITWDTVFSMSLEDKNLKTKLIAIPSTSGTASEVTQVSVITLEEQRFKLAIKTEHIRPDIAILDPNLPITLPAHIVAETGMDALTHALEAYINKNGNDFTDALAKEAIEGIMEWLPISYKEGTVQSREKIHNFQCMAGMAFSNAGLGMVHGVSHAFGGKYNLAHGLVNAIILPYSMDYNKKDAEVAAKYTKLSRILEKDIIEGVKQMNRELDIAACIADTGIAEADFKKDFHELLQNSMKGPTVVNPIKVSLEDMEKFINCVYFGIKVEF